MTGSALTLRLSPSFSSSLLVPLARKPTQNSLNTQVSARRSASLTGVRAVTAAAPKPASLTMAAASARGAGGTVARRGGGTERASVVVRASDAPAPLSTGNDVYGGPARLKEGLRRQTMLIYVADETGMINRVAGVFARRGYNIESLAVGLNIDKAIFTVVVIASDSDATKLIKQINKLAKVRKVENITDKMCVERGLMLIKVREKVAGAGGRFFGTFNEAFFFPFFSPRACPSLFVIHFNFQSLCFAPSFTQRSTRRPKFATR